MMSMRNEEAICCVALNLEETSASSHIISFANRRHSNETRLVFLANLTDILQSPWNVCGQHLSNISEALSTLEGRLCWATRVHCSNVFKSWAISVHWYLRLILLLDIFNNVPCNWLYIASTDSSIVDGRERIQFLYEVFVYGTKRIRAHGKEIISLCSSRNLSMWAENLNVYFLCLLQEPGLSRIHAVFYGDRFGTFINSMILHYTIGL